MADTPLMAFPPETVASIAQLMMAREGWQFEEALKFLGSPDGLKLLTMMQDPVGGDLEKVTTLAESEGRLKFYSKCIEPLLRQTPDSARAFCVDLGTGNGFYPSRFLQLWPDVRWYLTERPADGGISALELTRATMETLIAKGVKPDALKVTVKSKDKAFYKALMPLDTLSSGNAAKTALARAVEVDVKMADWAEVSHLEGSCRLVTCFSLLTQVGYLEPLIWRDVLRGASKLLEPGGSLVFYDGEKWGGFGKDATMSKYIKEKGLGLTLVSKTEPVDYSDDPDGKMFLLVFRKEATTDSAKSSESLLQRAEALKDRGNAWYSKKMRTDSFRTGTGRMSANSQRLWRAVAQYTMGIDCLELVFQKEQEGDKKQQALTLMSRLQSNLAAAYLEMGVEVDVLALGLKAIESAMEADPAWDKPRERREKILEAMKRPRQSS